MMALLRLTQTHGARLLRWRRGPGDRTLRCRLGGDDQQRLCDGRSGGECGPARGQARTGRMVGLDLPVTGTVQQVIVTEPAPPLARHLVAIANRHLSLKQQASGGFLIGGGWYGGFDPATGRSHNLRRNIEGNLWVCAKALPALRGTIDRARLDRDQHGNRPGAVAWRGAGVARLLQRRNGKRLYTSAR